MTELLVGLDLGGTKSAVMAQTIDGATVLDVVVPSLEWDAEPIGDGVRWVEALMRAQLPADAEVVALGLGAQGLDNPAVAQGFTDGLAKLGYRSRCVNDAELLVPAAGFSDGIGLISGTGAIGVATDVDGNSLITGGWGWVIGDEAGAAGIVREATKLALLGHDDGDGDDGLLSALLIAFNVTSAERLARIVNDLPTMDNWGPAAPAVFDAAAGGSVLAHQVVISAAQHLARLVDQLVRRGAVGTNVVAAGGVITRQPLLFNELEKLVHAGHPGFSTHLLADPPVVGALALARRVLAEISG